MPKVWISYGRLKRILGAIVILISLGSFYSIYSNINLFSSGYRVEGIVSWKTHYLRAGWNSLEIKYNYNDHDFTAKVSPIVDGSFAYSLGDKVAVHLQQGYPNNFTISRANTSSVWGYLLDHTLFFFKVIIGIVFFIVGFQWLFRTRKQLSEAKF